MAYVRALWACSCATRRSARGSCRSFRTRPAPLGMEGMFRQLGMYAPQGQLYRPHDADQLMWYREDQSGQILQEGITEAGAMASWIASATAYSTHGVQTSPVLHLLLDIRLSAYRRLSLGRRLTCARGAFLIGGTAGRTTLNGEGLQHEDGHSHLFAAAIPNLHVRTIPRTVTRSPSSSKTACAAC